MTRAAMMAILWVAATGALVALLGVQTRWGRTLEQPVPDLPDPPRVAVTASVLPDFRLDTGLDQMPETSARTLFNPTRRPAPPPPPPKAEDAPKPQIRKGQFALLGTSISGDKKTALLREVATGKVVRVSPGMSVNQMNVAEIRADRVVLAFAGETEELPLRVATGRGTVVAQPPPAPVAPAAVGRPTPIPGRTVPALIPRPRSPTPGAGARPPQLPVVPNPAVPPQPAGTGEQTGATRFLTPQAVAPSVQAARDANAAAEWRRLEERLRAQMGAANPK